MPAPSRAMLTQNTAQYLTLPLENFDERHPNEVDTYDHSKTLDMQRSDTMPALNVLETTSLADLAANELNPEILLLENETHQNFNQSINL